jgi:dihydroorotate dehydrogenase (NAD+) catalytic subunit
MDMTVDFAGLRLSNPVFTASGTCGYADELADFIDPDALGGFITKSITLEPRKGNPPPRIVETDSGMLNAIGWANIGLEAFCREKIPVIESRFRKAAVFVNVAGKTAGEYAAVARRLAREKAISGLELNISCPNVEAGGMAFGMDPALAAKVTEAVKKACGGKVLVVKLAPMATDISAVAAAVVEAGADALSLVNTFTAMVVDVETRRPVLANKTGGLSGPAIRPIAVWLVNKVYNDLGAGRVPILAGGGIRTASDAVEFMIAGASAVSVGTAGLVDPACAVKVAAGIEDYCRRRGIARAAELTGSLAE